MLPWSKYKYTAKGAYVKITNDAMAHTVFFLS